MGSMGGTDLGRGGPSCWDLGSSAKGRRKTQRRFLWQRPRNWQPCPQLRAVSLGKSRGQGFLLLSRRDEALGRVVTGLKAHQGWALQHRAASLPASSPPHKTVVVLGGSWAAPGSRSRSNLGALAGKKEKSRGRCRKAEGSRAGLQPPASFALGSRRHPQPLSASSCSSSPSSVRVAAASGCRLPTTRVSSGFLSPAQTRAGRKKLPCKKAEVRAEPALRAWDFEFLFSISGTGQKLHLVPARQPGTSPGAVPGTGGAGPPGTCSL